MGSTLSTERIHNENGTGEMQNIENNSNIIMNTVSNNIQTIQNENATVETQTIVQNNVIFNNTSSKEPELDDYNFPKPIDSFKGREGEIEQLEDYLFQKDREMVVIWGLPGFGKSELIKHFAQKCKLNNKIKYICWIEASNKDTLEHSLKNLAEILHLPKVDGRVLIQKVSSRYQDSGTLFLFDDVDSPRSLQDWKTPRGCWTLVSSQCGTWGTKPKIELDPLELEAAVSVLQHLQDPAVAADPDLYTLAKLLGNAPLALQLAAAYIREEMEHFPENFSVLKYIKKLENSREKFVNEPLPEDTFLPYRYSIQAAIKLSIEKIRNLNKFESNLALEILNILAYLDPNQILEILLLEFSFVQNKLKEAEDEDEERDPGKEVRRALHVLQSHSIVHLEDDYVRIHGLVQDSLLFYHNKLNVNIEALYTSCLNYVLNNKFNSHFQSILRQADKNLEIFKKFYEENKSKIIENKSSLNYVTVVVLIVQNLGVTHETISILSELKNHIELNLEFHIENIIKDIVVLKNSRFLVSQVGAESIQEIIKDVSRDISNFSFLQILVLARAEKCLTFSIEELGSQAKEVISEHQLFFSAIYSQQPNTINLLIKYGEDINKIIVGGLPIIHVAVCILNIDNLNFLLERNVIDMNARCKEGCTCLAYAIIRRHYDECDVMEKVSAELIEKIRILVAHGASVYNVTKCGSSLLHAAVDSIKDPNIVEFIIDELQVDVDYQHDSGMTALHGILDRREMHKIDDELTSKIVDILVKRGASIYVEDDQGYSPLDTIMEYKFHFLLPILESNNVAGSFHVLHYAVSILNLDILNVILEYNNTDVNTRDDDGRTCICKALFSVFVGQDTGDNIYHVIRVLVDRGVSVYNVYNDGSSLLHIAVLHIETAKDLKVVEFIIDELQVDVNTRNTYGRTALDVILNRRILYEIDDEFTGKLVEILVKRGASIHVEDNDGDSPLKLIKGGELHFLLPILESNNVTGNFHVLHYTVSILNLDILNIILEYNKTDVNARDDDGLTCICKAFMSSFNMQLDIRENICDVIRALVDRGASVYNVTNDGCSLLHMAVRWIKNAKDLKVVEFIVDELQLNVDTRDINGRTTLHFILMRRKKHEIDDELTGKLVDMLVKRGASIHVKDNAGYGSLDIIEDHKIHFLLPILESNNVTGSFHVLHYAVSILNLDILNNILEYNKTDVNARDDDGLTCICKAFMCSFNMQLDIRDNICDVIRALVVRGASVYNVTNDGCSLLHMAVRWIKNAKDLKVVEFIVDELQVDVNTRDNNGMTALHLIFGRRHSQEIDDLLTGKVVDILMKRGAIFMLRTMMDIVL